MGLGVSKPFSAPSDGSLRWMVLVLCLVPCLWAFASPATAQQVAVTLDPAATQIHFTLNATLHTVHGAFKLKSGQIQWDRATGHASGSIVIDATSGNTDNSSRDKNMHTQVLESAKFPEITFTPSQIKGAFSKEGTSELAATGVIRLHGQDHDQTLNLAVQTAANGTWQASTQFPVPYVQWGIKDPSTFLLHVADTVNVEIRASATVAP
jgi:polyisoprenoid-binding protein YceI